MMRQGSILILSDYVGGGGAATGGAGLAALDSYRALAASGARVELITGFALPPALVGNRHARGLNGADLRMASKMQALKTVHNPDSIATLSPLLAKFDPSSTVVVLHQWTRYLSPSVISALRNFPLMVYMHDYFWACPNGAYFNFARERPCRHQPMSTACVTSRCDRESYGHKLVRVARQARRLAASANAVHAPVYLHISKRARETAEGILPIGIHETIYNPLLLPLRQPTTDQRCDFDIAYFGRLETEKGVGMLLETARRGGLRGLFVGEGSLAARIAETPHMTLLPWQDPVDLPRIMRRCRVVALPSLWPETWGLVAAEAMAAGVPVLVSSRAGSAELVERFGGGATFDPATPSDLDETLSRLLSGGPLPISDEAWEEFRLFLSPDAHARRITELAANIWEIDLNFLPSPPAVAA